MNNKFNLDSMQNKIDIIINLVQSIKFELTVTKIALGIITGILI